MALKLLINGIDRTSVWRPYESAWSARAWNGESTQSTFVLDDEDGTIDHLDLASQKIIEVTEDASGAEIWLYRGRLTNKTLGRGQGRTGAAMRWTINSDDSNWDAGYLRVTTSNRPVESDQNRVLAYRAGYLNGVDSTNAHARDSTRMGAGYIRPDQLYELGAETYRDTYPNEVFRRICEMTGKTWFVLLGHDGTMHLYYAPVTDQTYLTDINLRDDGVGIDDVDTYAVKFTQDAGQHDGQHVLTGGSVRFGEEGFYEDSDVTTGAEDFHDKVEEHFTDEYITTTAQAQVFLENMVASRVNESFNYAAEWEMAAENVHRLKAGMAISLTLAAANAPVTFDTRCTQLTVTPLYPDADGNARYKLNGEFGIPRGPVFVRNVRRVPTPTPRPPRTSQTLPVDSGSIRVGPISKTGSTLVAADLPAEAAVGDWAIVNVGHDGDNGEIPGIHADWTPIGLGANDSTGNIGHRGARKLLDAADIASGSWTFGAGATLASSFVGAVYRHLDPVAPIGTIVGDSNSGGTVDWPAITRTTPPSRIFYAAHCTTDGTLGTDTIAGGTMEQITSARGGEHGCWDSVTDESATHSASSTTNSHSRWQSHGYELIPDPSPTVTTSGDTHEDLAGERVGVYALIDHDHIVERTSNPTVNDDEDDGYPVGITWRNTTTDVEYRLEDNTAGAAVWVVIVNNVFTANFIIDGGGSVLTTGEKGDISFDIACTIEQVQLRSRISGSVVVDIKKSTTGTYDTFSSICAAAKPTLSSAKISTDSTLTGWTKTIAAGDILNFTVDSVTSVQRVAVALKLRKT